MDKTYAEPGQRVDPLLELLETGEYEIDKSKIRDSFIQLWEFENGDSLKPEIQYLTTIALFMYTTHNTLGDYNVRQDKARKMITSALTEWTAPEREKEIAEEKSSDNPFKTFVEKQTPKIDAIYSWESFLLDHKRCDEKEWTYKMDRCWFAQFFIRFGRTDYIETACCFDQIPAKAREDYVDLKLNNMFMKLGTYCKFKYTPKA
ncbi:MAG: hypothetical protein COV66_14185 [Nitrospinae bacterium CG11_big_fil_rev_8_21_14_0_20_45_15]|nr:MAG: hypothetical protein COV66_14185 [Nitrospinae bacterium CG11_big_fil_rev_8_21_14_0_20_45_15]